MSLSERGATWTAVSAARNMPTTVTRLSVSA